MRTVGILGVLLLLAMSPGKPAKADAPVIKHPLAQTHAITIDATSLKPAKAWSIPGVTEPLQSMTGPKTNQIMTVDLRPGRYMFTTTSLSFEFTVNLEGKLDYAKMHDQCVSGRGTSQLSVNCRFTMPQ